MSECRSEYETQVLLSNVQTLTLLSYSKLGTVVKNPPRSAGDARDAGSIPGLGRSPGVGTGNPLQYSCQENSMDRGAWQATVMRS